MNSPAEENVSKETTLESTSISFESSKNAVKSLLGDHNENGKKLKYKCSFNNCNQYFRREKDLDKHEFQHNQKEKYPCNYPECKKKYRLRAHLKRHIQIYHEKKKNDNEIKCEIATCDRKFSSKFSLKRHLKEFHEKLRKFQCTQCDRVYERKNHLKLHLITHTKEYPFKCYKCDVGFVSETIFKRHSCLEYNCDKCDEKFKKWSELVKHRRQYHPLSSYNCNECNEEFETKQKLRTHKKVHKERLYCTWEGCKNSYLDDKNLKQHINVKHLGKKYKCTIEGCDQELSSKSKLNYHIRLHERPSVSAMKRNNKKNRKKRKDAGLSKKSIVNILANIVVKSDVENLTEHDTTSETDGEDRHGIKNLA